MAKKQKIDVDPGKAGTVCPNCGGELDEEYLKVTVCGHCAAIVRRGMAGCESISLDDLGDPDTKARLAQEVERVLANKKGAGTET